MLAFAAVAARERPGHRAWAGYTIVIALTLLALAWSYAAGHNNLSDLMLIADGVVLLPLWLAWTGRIDGIEYESPSAVTGPEQPPVSTVSGGLQAPLITHRPGTPIARQMHEGQP